LLIEQKGAVITSDDLPVVAGIPVQIHQLFTNLLSNALKFNDTVRAPRVNVSCSTIAAADLNNKDLKQEKRYYRISFHDNGIGFSQAHANQIFEIFQRLHGKQDYEGTGIGLAMCKKIAQNHNGDIYAESSPGQGASFHIILPQLDTTGIH
jgi:signal transduction histidine kinase